MDQTSQTTEVQLLAIERTQDKAQLMELWYILLNTSYPYKKWQNTKIYFQLSNLLCLPYITNRNATTSTWATSKMKTLEN